MNRNVSTYLDSLRFFAAMLVFFNHFSSVGYLGGHGSSAVACFFVLSGFAITFTAMEKEPLLRFNDLADFQRLLAESDDIAAIIVEPELANAAVLSPIAAIWRSWPPLHERGASSSLPMRF